MEEVLEFSSDEEMPARSTTDVIFTYTDSARTKNTLKASQVDQFVYADSTLSKISGGFTLTFYNRAGEFDGQLTALNAIIYDKNAMMIARDSVVFINDLGEALRTEELIWVQDSAMVYTDKFVTIERESGVIYGKGLRSNENFTNYNIQQPVGELYLNDAKQ